MGIDHRFPISFYYRTANHLVNQAKVCREENINDLYAVLNRYVSLVSRDIPKHPMYSSYAAEDKLHHTKTLKNFLKEMEILKVALKSYAVTSRKLQKSHSNSDRKSQLLSVQSASTGKVSGESVPGFDSSRQDSLAQYPSLKENDDICFAGVEDSDFLSINAYGDVIDSVKPRGCDITSWPSAAVSYIESVPVHEAQISHINFGSKSSEPFSDADEGSPSKISSNIHISVRLMDDFLEVARSNTEKNLETCGVLGACLKKGTYYVTTLIIPKQESTSDSCQTLKEEEIYAIQDDQSLFPVGWIHTHPSQSCFMSSIDLHTHYSYQVMLPEAVAIVVAPSDESRKFGIFRLSDPSGITALRGCEESGFHPHTEPSSGSPIYVDCDNVYMNSNLRFEVIDLR